MLSKSLMKGYKVNFRVFGHPEKGEETGVAAEGMV